MFHRFQSNPKVIRMPAAALNLKGLPLNLSVAPIRERLKVGANTRSRGHFSFAKFGIRNCFGIMGGEPDDPIRFPLFVYGEAVPNAAIANEF